MTYVEEFFRTLITDLFDKFRIGGRNITDGISEALDFSARYRFKLFNLDIALTDASVALIISTIITLILAIIFSYRLKLEKIGRRQAVVELVYTKLDQLMKSMGLSSEMSADLIPWIASIFSIITFSSLVDLLKMRPAASNPSFPISLVIFTLFFIIFKGIQYVGVKGFLRSLCHPMPALIPFQILDYLIKPVSLAFRLFGNIFGSFILIEFVSLVIPMVFPTILGIWFDFGDGILQSLVFTLLTVKYISEIVEKNEEMLEIQAHKREEKLREVSTST